ncbi:MAG: peptidoglycan DD-metalloendopeptidase family protein [Rudaea sp.]
MPSQFAPPARAASEPPASSSAAAAPVVASEAGAEPAPRADLEGELPRARPGSVSTPITAAAPPVPLPPVAVAPVPAVDKTTEAPAKPVSEGAVANAGGIAWRWPNTGKLLGGFVAGDQTRQGVDIAGSAGDPVRAAADGEVVYSGNGLIGYGELIIVKHNASFLSAYGHNRKRLVQEGEKVRAGQQIAEMGSSASSRDELHFEIRKNGKPVNPMDYLPAR